MNRASNKHLPSSLKTHQGSKGYRAQALLGHETDTQDAEGEATVHGEWGHVTTENVDAALGQFVGDITQVPPMFSALHKDGKRLYELARKGITVRMNKHGGGGEGKRAKRAPPAILYVWLKRRRCVVCRATRCLCCL